VSVSLNQFPILGKVSYQLFGESCPKKIKMFFFEAFDMGKVRRYRKVSLNRIAITFIFFAK